MTTRRAPGGLVPPAVLRLLAAATLATALGGCNQIAGLIAVFEPPQKVQALYKPAPGKKILVLVEDRHFPLSYEAVKGDLTEKINRLLVEHKVTPSVVPFERIQELAASTSDYGELAVGKIGQKLQADLVVYVQVEDFALKDAAKDVWHGRFQTSVYVVDVQKGRVWPADNKAYEVPPVNLHPEESMGSEHGINVADRLTDQMAESIAKLFYDYEVTPQEQLRGPIPSD